LYYAPLLNIKNLVPTAERGDHTDFGWPNSAYSVSKIGESALTRILAKQYKGRFEINACCPGWCKTDMAGDSAPRTAEEGADTPVYLALSSLDPSEGTLNVTGAFFGERQQISW